MDEASFSLACDFSSYHVNGACPLSTHYFRVINADVLLQDDCIVQFCIVSFLVVDFNLSMLYSYTGVDFYGRELAVLSPTHCDPVTACLFTDHR